MANQLFIVCPFSCVENFLRDKFENTNYFISCSGAVLQYQELASSVAIRDFIFNANIKTIYIVNDTSCRFINSIIKRDKLSGVYSELSIQALYIEHYLTDFKDQSLFAQQRKLAELNIKKQAIKMVNSSLIGSCIADFDIAIKGLITSKENNLYQEIIIENNFKKKYEL